MPLHETPFTDLEGAPFVVLPIVKRRFWREIAVWFAKERVLVCGDALGSLGYFHAKDEPFGVHPFLRLLPPRKLEALEPDRIGHGVRSADDPAVLAMLAERGTVLEVCPSSNLSTRVLSGIGAVRRVVRALDEHRVRYTISTDGPEMLRSYLRDELLMLMRNEILDLDQVHRAVEVGHEATFLDRAPIIESSVTGSNGRAPIPVGAGSIRA